MNRISMGILLAVLTAVANAATAEPERVVNEKYHFAFTCEAGSIITYQKGGSGFTCFRQTPGSADQGGYALLVFGSSDLDASTAAVEEAGLAGKEGSVGISNQPDLDKVMLAEMEVAKRTHGGSAKVLGADGRTLEVPYATWSQRSGAKTHYALNYVVLHEHKFVNVQVESDQPLTAEQVEWLTTKLELLTAVTADKPAS